MYVVLSALAATAAPKQSEADAAFEKRDWAKAAQAYQKETAAAPEKGVSWLRLGIALVQLGRGADAVAPLQTAEKLGINQNVVEYQLAQAAALTGDKGRALTILKALADDDFFPAGGPAAKEKAFASVAADPDFAKLFASFETNRAPCVSNDPTSPYRQFDFWLGDWNVVDKGGNPVGTTHVERVLEGCVLLESWHGVAGGEGRSFSTFNPGLKRWEQYWVDGQGVPIFFNGNFEGADLALRADSANRSGAPLMRRVTFSKLPQGRVRQLSEASSDAGRRWAVEYDFTYLPKPVAPPPAAVPPKKR